MQAELIFVGTELLLGQILNTNAQALSQRLAGLGVDVFYQTVVGDNPERLAAALRQAIGRSEVVITCGGLGPTLDDITREVTAEVLGLPLELDEQIKADLEAFYQWRGLSMPPSNLRQAQVPKGASILPNPAGTAPGLRVPVPTTGGAVFLLPGPPGECLPMFDNHVAPQLGEGGQARLISRTLRFAGIGESALAEALTDLIKEQRDPTIAPYAKIAEVHLRLATKAVDEAAGLAKIKPVEDEIIRRVGTHLYGFGETSLEEAVGQGLRERGLRLAVAESCTGGLLGERITGVPGSSEWFLGGLITYANTAKVELLGVPETILEQEGAVSEACAAAMARGALRRLGADVALSITGIAGPGGGSEEKPVGLVYIGLVGRDGTCEVQESRYWGSRAEIRWRSSQEALVMLRRYLLDQ